MNRKWIFSDETENFCRPAEPKRGEKAALCLRTAKGDFPQVFVCHDEERILMRRSREDGLFAWFQAETPPLYEPWAYHYELRSDDEVLFVNRLGVCDRADDTHDFCLIPDFQVPDWSRGAVIYQIYTDRFCNGDPANDVQNGEYLCLPGHPSEQVKNWQSLPEPMDVHRFYGGDLQGVRSRLDYLQSLGVEVIYFNPLFVSPSNHKYDTQDYDHIDPHFGVICRDGGELLEDHAGSNAQASRYVQRTTAEANLTASDQLFATLVQEAHARGIRVILDGVFNHCGSFHKWMNREGLYRQEQGYPPGAFAGKQSPYRDYFSFDENGNYESWWGYDTLPKLNYEASEELCEEILRIGRKWVSPPFCADGWRLDVAADLGHSAAFNHAFWQRFRREVKKANPQAVILAEHYGDVRPWLKGGEWDSVMNYDGFMEPLTWFLTGMEKHSDERREDWEGDVSRFWSSMREAMSRFPHGALQAAMNQLDNHDHSRFLTRTNRTVGRIGTQGSGGAAVGVDYGVYREAVVVQMTWPGAPAIYYGDETGLPGWTDPDNRRTFPWGQEDWDLIEFYRYTIGYHRQHPALQKGSLMPLPTGNHMLAYARFWQEDRVLVTVNNRRQEAGLSIDLRCLGVEKGCLIRELETFSGGYNVGRKKLTVDGGCVNLVLKPTSAVIFRVETE